MKKRGMLHLPRMNRPRLNGPKSLHVAEPPMQSPCYVRDGEGQLVAIIDPVTRERKPCR